MSSDDNPAERGISIDVGAGVSRRGLVKQLGAASAAVGLAGCGTTSNEEPTDTDTDGGGGGGNGGGGDDNDGGGGEDQPDFEFSRHPAVAPPTWDPSKTREGSGENRRTAVFVLQNIDNPFFIPMTCGFHDALNMFGWDGQVTGPPANGGIPDQVSLINQNVSNMEPGDVLVTTVLNNEAYNDAIQNALDNDIVVVNGHSTPATKDWNYDYMTDDVGFSYRDQPMIVPHVGIRDARGGAAMAAEAYDRMQEKMPDKDEYTVLITNELPDNPSVTRRVSKDAADLGTAERYFKAQSDPSVTLYNDQIINPPASIADAQTQIVNTISGEDVDAVVCSAFWGAVGAGQALEAGELEGPMVVCGFDLLRPLLNQIEAGTVDFTVGQDPYSQGFQNVPLAWMYIERGIEMKDLEWGVSVWDQENVDFALERRSWAGDNGLLQWQESNYDFLQ
ncbi:substrate-binding domain-containing protein [Haloarchaeobius litoreus]|uniref:Substrate-binding domain-containing protein n=1 Tax=Haloarchaeobius litoreus TaxID=755306 RepID=A0ABD6DKI9_9EURY|nr:substrate-binding domain-containing protein [Haloarchaeobius litoreus]